MGPAWGRLRAGAHAPLRLTSPASGVSWDGEPARLGAAAYYRLIAFQGHSTGAAKAEVHSGVNVKAPARSVAKFGIPVRHCAGSGANHCNCCGRGRVDRLGGKASSSASLMRIPEKTGPAEVNCAICLTLRARYCTPAKAWPWLGSKWTGRE